MNLLKLRPIAPATMLAVLLCATPSLAQDTPDTPVESEPAAVENPAPTEAPVKEPVEEKPVVTKTTYDISDEAVEGELVKPEPEVAPEPAVVAPATTTIERTDAAVDSEWNAGLEDFDRRYRWDFNIGGYIRTQYTNIDDDPDQELVGRNDGFILANARIGFAGSIRKKLGFKLQLDGAVDRAISDAERPIAEVDTRLRDAKIWWEPIRYTRLTVGQFKPPYDVEEQFSRDELLLIDRSVGSRGVLGFEGDFQEGLSRDREAGVMLSARPIFFGADPDKAEGFGVSYNLAATNGASSNLTLNDNDSLATYGRIGLHWGEMVRVGGAFYLNELTIDATEADNIEQSVFGFTADLTVKVSGLTLIGNMIQNTVTNTGTDIEPEVTSTAFMAQVGYQEPFFGFQPVFRFATYDPSSSTSGQSSDILFEEDARTYFTMGLNYNPRYPIRLMVNYTVTQEEGAQELDNNRFDALMQVTW